MISKRASFQKAFQKVRAAPFPKGITDDHVGDLFARLVEFDGYTNGLFQQILNGVRTLSHPLKRDLALKTALERIRNLGDEPAQSEAVKLLAYLEMLDDAIVCAQEYLAM